MLTLVFGAMVLFSMLVLIVVAAKNGFCLSCHEHEFMRMYFADVETGAMQKEDYYDWRTMRRFKRMRKQMGYSR